jgi:hypothetical protein
VGLRIPEGFAIGIIDNGRQQEFSVEFGYRDNFPFCELYAVAAVVGAGQAPECPGTFGLDLCPATVEEVERVAWDTRALMPNGNPVQGAGPRGVASAVRGAALVRPA